MPNYRKIYESVYGKIPIDHQGRPYEIHHIDGNHNNNAIDNLMCISIKEHYYIHYNQGDYISANLIAQRIDSTLLTIRGYKRPQSEKTKAKLRKPKLNKQNYKKPKSSSHKEAIRKARLGTKRSLETRLKQSIIKLGKTPIQNLQKTTCPICKKEGQKVAMKRWHFNNCKQKEVKYA
jgi:hypothetical protein